MSLVITGIGAITPEGSNIDDIWNDLLSGKKVNKSKVEDFNLSDYVNPWKARKMDRIGQFSTAAAVMAVNDSGLEITDDNREKIGSLYSTSNGSFETNRQEISNIVKNDLSSISAFWFPMTTFNSPLGAFSRLFNVKGPSSALVGSDPIMYSSFLLNSDNCDAVIIVGADEHNQLYQKVYDELGYLSELENYNLYDSSNVGFKYTEVFSSLIIEKKESALKRGAKIYCELSETYGVMDTITVPQKEQYITLNEDLLDNLFSDILSQTKDNESGVVFGLGNGTKIDNAEISVLKKNNKNNKLSGITNIRNYSGESFCGTNLLNIIAAALSLKNDVIPGIDSSTSEFILRKNMDKKHDFAIVNNYIPNGAISSHLLRKSN